MGVTRGTMGVTRGTMGARHRVTRGTTALGTMGPSGTHHHHGRGCRGCGCGVDVWIGGCYGCAEDYTDYPSCWQWDPDLGQWVNVCY